jgi:hypothetical protein
MMNIKALLILFLLPLALFGQKDIFLNIEPVFVGVPFEISTTYTHPSGDSYSFNYLKYYVSDVIVTHDGGQEFTCLPAVFLVSTESHLLTLGSYDVENIERIEFTLGVPARFNLQDGAEAIDISSYPEEHPLSFQSPSMYWGWAFGYMHVVTSGLPFFELHNIGAQLAKQVDLEVIQTETSSTQLDLEIYCNVDRWFNSIDLTSGLLISHGAESENVQMMGNLLTEEVFTMSAEASIDEQYITKPFVFYSPSGNQLQNLPVQTENITVTDQLGRKIYSKKVSNQSKVSLDFQFSGLAFITMHNAQGGAIESIKYIFP